ncbi:MAG: SDR family NAD(P)-dependent oxidoreductase [Planctomycetes bacterium]|nr:SDR family NAD(P)-dependent oxidoreductase [Planctomycetota bacterium]
MSKTILVTGASSGIGRAICERLLAEGHQVLGVARDFKKLPSSHPRFQAFFIDLSALPALPERLQAVAEAHPQVEAIVFNAGRGLFGSLEQLSPAQIRSLIDLNFTSHALLARAFLPALKKRGEGDLIFIGSEAALRGRRMGSIYCASKFALRGFAQALREECAASGVRVAVINPGMAQTPFYDGLDFAPGPEPANYLEPADVAQAVSLILAARPGTVFDEINLSPLKRVVRARSPEKKA